MIDFTYNDIFRLIKGELEPSDLNIGKIKLSNNFQEIPLDEIIDIGLFNKETGKYLDNGSDYTFKERLKTLQTHNAFIHLAGGLTYGITNEKITQIRITKQYIKDFEKLTKAEVESFIGQPERELIEDTMWGLDYSLDSLISVYKQGELYFYFEPEKLILKEIRVGIINEEFYSKK